MPGRYLVATWTGSPLHIWLTTIRSMHSPNCGDHLATDGYTIWGAPIAAYYPAAIMRGVQLWKQESDCDPDVSTSRTRPGYYDDNRLPQPDTMEPVWPSGRSEVFVDRFLNMIADGPAQSVAYAQLGQENSFGWPLMSQVYPMQMERLSYMRQTGRLPIATLSPERSSVTSAR